MRGSGQFLISSSAFIVMYSKCKVLASIGNTCTQYNVLAKLWESLCKLTNADKVQHAIAECFGSTLGQAKFLSTWSGWL